MLKLDKINNSQDSFIDFDQIFNIPSINKNKLFENTDLFWIEDLGLIKNNYARNLSNYNLN
jgi:hypothetical protein